MLFLAQSQSSNTAEIYANAAHFNFLEVIAIIFPRWTFPLFYKGYKKGLKEEDIYHHLKIHDSKLLGEKLEREWNKELKKKSPSLWKAFARVFGKDMMLSGLGVLAFELIRLDSFYNFS